MSAASGNRAGAGGPDKNENDMMRSLSHSLQRAWPSDKNMLSTLRNEQTMDPKKQETRIMSGLLRKASMLCKPGGGVNPNHKALMKDLVLSNDSNIQLALDDTNLANNASQLNRYLDLISYEKAGGNSQSTAEAARERRTMVKDWQEKLKLLKNSTNKSSTQASKEILEAEQRRIAAGLGSKRSRPGSMLHLTSFRDNNRVRTIPEDGEAPTVNKPSNLATIPGDKAANFDAGATAAATGFKSEPINFGAVNMLGMQMNGLNAMPGLGMLGMNAMPGNMNALGQFQMSNPLQLQMQMQMLSSAGAQAAQLGQNELLESALAQQLKLQQQLQQHQMLQQQQASMMAQQQQNPLAGLQGSNAVHLAAAQARAMGIAGIGTPAANPMAMGLNTQNMAAVLNNAESEKEAQRQQRLLVRREKKSKRERQRRLVLNTLYDELGSMLFSNNEHETKDRASILQAAIDHLNKECNIAIPAKTESEMNEDAISMSEQCIYPNCPNAAMQGKDCCFVHGGGGRKAANLSPEERLLRRRGKKSKREKQRRHNVNVLSEKLGEMLKVTEIKDKTTVLNVAISFLKQHPKTKQANPNTAVTADTKPNGTEGRSPGALKTGISFLRANNAAATEALSGYKR